MRGLLVNIMKMEGCDVHNILLIFYLYISWQPTVGLLKSVGMASSMAVTGLGLPCSRPSPARVSASPIPLAIKCLFRLRFMLLEFLVKQFEGLTYV